ncbi:T9SS sorting signal type C domain-containing protein [Flavobacterium eburneipallidum]|uniref:T9SS sorting signal type C domain-containing protein n=1 Tax=Flavobacterium eburneipallidum TaxID=3003263 RepID=UPI0024822872|nr:T9SS sorting signal type C domain-containing protein [Flavobacterium eburneipallidum]
MDKITLGFFQVKSKTTIKGLLLVFALLLMNTQSSWGQKLLQWNTSGNLGTETTEPTFVNDVNINASNLTQGSIVAAANGNRFGGSGWFDSGNTVAGNTLTEAVSGNNYIQFIVTPNSGYSFTPTSFVFKWDRSGTGPSNVTLRSSVDNFTSDLGSVAGMVSGGVATTTDRTITISGLENITTPTTFRIYAYGATASGGTGGFDCAAGSTSNVVLNGTTAVIWNGSSWSNTTGPDATIEAVIDGTYNTNVGGNQGVFTAKKLTVTSQGALTINSGTNVTVQNEVINNGSLVVENNANLIQVNNMANSGNVVVKRNGNSLYRLDYTLWSSPVASQNLAAFSPLTSQSPSRFYDYNSSLNRYAVIADPSTTSFVVGKGNLIRMPNTNPLAGYDEGTSTLTFEGIFSGVLNNGNISVTLSDLGNKFNLVGNPYSSILDAELFLDANVSNIENTLYFWRKKNAASGSAYATYTDGGGTTTELGIPTPNGKIQVGQGFFVQAKLGITVSDFFTNAMREVTPSSTQFYKTQKGIAKDRLWLNLTTTTGVFSQALVAYISDAKSGLDSYDGKYINDSPIALTSAINNEEYTIQGRPTFDATDVVALNFKTDVAGDYTIAIDHVDGLFAAGQDIYLVDSKTGTETNLKNSAYTFTTTSGSDNTRFSLKYQKTLNVDESIFDENAITVYKNNGNVFVKSANSIINDIQVYDVQGRLILTQNDVNSNTATINNLKANHQILIVKVMTQDNKVVIKKVAN